MNVKHPALLTAARYLADNMGNCQPDKMSGQFFADYIGLCCALISAAQSESGTSSASYAKAMRLAKKLNITL